MTPRRPSLALLARLVLVPLVPAAPAAAADWYTGAEPPLDDGSWAVAVDTATVVTSNSSAFGVVTLTAAPLGGPLTDGVRVRAEGLAGTYTYPGGEGRRVQGEQEEGAALVGYEWVWRDAALAGYVGLNARRNDLSIPDPGNPVVGTRLGAKVAVNFFATPTPATFVSVLGSYATTFNAYYSRFRFGALMAPGVYVGPEVLFLGDDFFRQWRAGAHVTGLTLGPLAMSAAVGYVEDRVQRGGFYTSLEARARF